MPKLTVSPCWSEEDNAFRVCVPQALRGEFKAARLFRKSEAEAQEICDRINKARQGWSAQILALGDSTMGRILRCLELAGNDVANLERAVTKFAHLKANQEKAFSEAVDEYSAGKAAAGKSKGYVYGITFTFKGLLAQHGGKKVSEITLSDIEAHMDGNGWRGTTRQNVLRYCKGFFAWAMKRGYAAENPCVGIEKPKSDKQPIRCLSVEEASALLKAAYETDRPMVSYIALGLFMGGRKSEIRRFESENVRGTCVEVAGHKAKTGRRRTVTPPPVLLAWLKISSDLKWSNWQRRFEAIREAAGITTWGNGPLRHTFCSYAIQKFGPGDTAYMAGHDQRLLWNTYTARVEPTEVPKYWNLFPETVLGAPANVVALPAAA